MTRLALLLSALLAVPCAAHAQGDAPAAEGDEPAEPTGEAAATSEEPAEAAPANDPLTERMLGLVEGYYTGVDANPGPEERGEALRAIRLMLLDGVALARIEAAVAEAIRLHTPGRAIPFHIAVPLRVRPADAEAPSSFPAPTTGTPSPAPARPVNPELEARRAERRRVLQEKRARIRLHRQWRDRTREKRALMSIGIPLWAAGYGLGFGTAAMGQISGTVDHSDAWLTAIPVVGNLAFGIRQQGAWPTAFVLFGLETAGIALTTVGFVLKVDWPYERDPSAQAPRRRGPRNIGFAPTPTGAVVFGQF